MAAERRERILDLVAEGYIETARDVPSAAVARTLGTSSATIRNEFAALEEEGLLRQPHTSAGRRPTADGFRRYASRHLPPKPLDPLQRRLLARTTGRGAGLDRLRRLVLLASQLSGYAVVLEVQRDGDLRSVQIHLTPLGGTRLLAVAVTDDGWTRDLALTIDPRPDDGAVVDAEAVLRQIVVAPSDMASAIRQRAAAMRDDVRRTLSAVADAWAALRPTLVVSHGLGRLLEEPEAADPGFVRRASRWLERGGWAHESGPPPAGPSLSFDEDVALVTAHAAVDGALHGARIAFVGPERMRYPRAFAVAHEVASTLGSARGLAS